MNAQTTVEPLPVQRDTGPVLRRSCGCGGSCGPCADKEKKKHELQRSPDGSHSSSFARDFSSVPATRSINVRVGPADDHFEREADRVADRVVSGGSSAPSLTAKPSVQREVDDEPEPVAFEEDEGPEIDPYNDPTGQPQFEEGASMEGGTAHVPVGSGGGTPLDSATRGMMQERIGHDFSSVRVHHDADAARAAASVHARAFTVGSDIYFAAGRYAPSSPTGQRLLAHELTHVVQQSGGSSGALVQRAPDKKKKKAPAKKAEGDKGETKKKTEEKKAEPRKSSKGKVCATKDCDGTCASPTNAEVVHPYCGNEVCPDTDGPADKSFFIRHIDVDLSSQMAVTVWGDSKSDLAVSEPFLTSPHPDHTPTGNHTIGYKCTACHTNQNGDGMAWFTGFSGYQYGFHNSQKVAVGTKSHGCVRVKCGCAKAIHDNTWSTVTSVCIHTGSKGCKALPAAGKKSAHTFVCGDLFDIAKTPSPGGSGTPAPSKDVPKKTEDKKEEPPAKKDLPVSSLMPRDEEDFA